MTRCYDEAFRPLGLRSTQMPILALAKKMGPIAVTELAKTMVMDHTTMVRNIRLLEKRGLVRIETGSDRREHHILLTDRGEAPLESGRPSLEKGAGEYYPLHWGETF